MPHVVTQLPIAIALAFATARQAGVASKLFRLCTQLTP